MGYRRRLGKNLLGDFEGAGVRQNVAIVVFRGKNGVLRMRNRGIPEHVGGVGIEGIEFQGMDKGERDTIPADWLAEFEAAERRPLAQRMKYAFIRTYKPVLDDARFRAFDSTAEYRRWCEESLPDWLGYGRV